MPIKPFCPIHDRKHLKPIENPNPFGKMENLEFCTCCKLQTPINNENTTELKQEAESYSYSRNNFSRQSTYRDNYYDYRPNIYACQTRMHCGCEDQRTERDERAEEEAMQLNIYGNCLFADGKYSQALNAYTQAHDKSREFGKRLAYSDHMDIARIAIENAHQIIRGDNCLFYEKNYLQAQNFYSQAVNNSRICAQRQICHSRLVTLQSEMIAQRLASEGHILFEQGKYSEAIEKYTQAYNTSIITVGDYRKYQQQYQMATNVVSINPSQPIVPSENYMSGRDKAKLEVDAEKLNSEGDHLCKQGKYKEAERKYQEAYEKSKVSVQVMTYKVNVDKAKVEVDAIQLNSQGDDLFHQGKFTAAEIKYQEAYDKSQMETQKNIFSKNKNKIHAVLNELMSLDKSWIEAWDAEYDTEKDRYEEATKIFQKVLDQSNDNLKMFPGNPKLKQYKTLASLKIEGNKLFNEGLESQETGMTLLNAAQKLKQQHKYKQADTKFKEANNCLQKALEKFEIGRQKDKESTRFASSIEIVQEHINVVIQSIEITNRFVLSAGLHDLKIADDDSHKHETDATGKHTNYSQHI